MADEGVSKTDKKIKKVEKQINQVYKQAQEEIEEKMKSFNDKLVIKNSIKLQEFKDGKITKDDYQSWLAGQAFQAQQWNSKRDEICDVLHNANAQATAIVNGGTIDTFAEGANWTAYSLEHTAGVNFGFGLYDSTTVTNLIANDPDILPKWKIDEPKEYIWNKQKVNNCVTQGIIQGESLDKIATRIATVTANQNRNLALTHARTAMTGAQNAGRTQRLQNASKMGLNVVKEWMATLDGHTRDSHRHMDGEVRKVGDQWHPMKFSNGCRYPGDPQGPAHEVFNCRCTLVGDLKDYPEEYQRYDNIDGVPIKNMTYKEWAKAKGLDKPKVPKVSDEKKTVDRKVYSILSRYKSFDELLDGISESEYQVLEDAGLDGTTIMDLMTQIKKGQVQSDTAEILYLEGVNTLYKKDPRKTQYHDNYVGVVRANYHTNDAEAEGMLNAGVQHLVDSSDIGSRIDADTLIKVLDDGRFKNQFETGTSGGALSFSGRTYCEKEVFGAPTDTADVDRPVYGMLFPKVENPEKVDSLTAKFYKSGPGSWYGDSIVVFNKERIANNTTLTLGDSLDNQFRVSATRLNEPVFTSASTGHATLLADPSHMEWSNARYVNEVSQAFGYAEVQLHGIESHSIDNIERVIIRRGARNADKLTEKLDGLGIPYTWME